MRKITQRSLGLKKHSSCQNVDIKILFYKKDIFSCFGIIDYLSEICAMCNLYYVRKVS